MNLIAVWLRGKALAKMIILTGIVTVMPMARPAGAITQATAEARDRQYQQQARQIYPGNYDLRLNPLVDAKESHWRNILWTTALLEPQEPYVIQAIEQILELSTRRGLSSAQKRILKTGMQVGTQLYTGNPVAYNTIGQWMLRAAQSSPDPQFAAMGLSALAQAGVDPQQLLSISRQLQQRFPNWQNNVFLYTTIQDIALRQAPTPMPPLQDLLSWQVAPNQLHLYVLCRPNRWVLCQAILKDKQGKLVQQSDGQVWSVPLLLRSLHGLSWNFERGQTPQGIYRMEGVVPQPDLEYFRAYGQFDLVKLFVPYEPGVKSFLPGRRGGFTGGLSTYRSLLPPSWRNYYPIQQSYWAGKAGRGLFRIHGTGDAPTLFANNQRYPQTAAWNPTIGCLSALELYDESGRLQRADMPKILAELRQLGGPNFTGYVIVVDVPGDDSQPISLENISTKASL
ncbi:MAG: hypothetical protein NZ772_00605 [Cyanobacteria bacterium]|nr:hypothetical protein [Cyanobacteriota bacterium]MDW8199872.1 hypothetical protein [Cyanobacteriota bacterium SKYGB_h_bin112]